MKLIYRGPHDGVAIDSPAHGFYAEVGRDEEVQVPDSLGEQLLEQPSNWEAAAAPEPAAKSTVKKPAADQKEKN